MVRYISESHTLMSHIVIYVYGREKSHMMRVTSRRKRYIKRRSCSHYKEEDKLSQPQLNTTQLDIKTFGLTQK